MGYGYNTSYPYMGGGMMGYGGYGYNGTADWSAGPMMGQNGFAGGYGMWGGWGGSSLPYYGILYGLLMLLMLLSWTIVGVVVME